MQPVEQAKSAVVRVMIPDAEASFDEVARTAVRESMHMVSSGKGLILCSVIPPGRGWTKFALKEKPAAKETVHAL